MTETVLAWLLAFACISVVVSNTFDAIDTVLVWRREAAERKKASPS